MIISVRELLTGDVYKRQLGIGFFIPVFVTFLETGRVGKIPTLIVCGFAVVGAIQSLFSGLVLQTMVQKNRQDFEMELQRIQEQYNKLL